MVSDWVGCWAKGISETVDYIIAGIDLARSIQVHMPEFFGLTVPDLTCTEIDRK